MFQVERTFIGYKIYYYSKKDYILTTRWSGFNPLQVKAFASIKWYEYLNRREVFMASIHP